MDMNFSSTTPGVTLRRAQAEDAAVLFELIQGLAEYEQLSHQVTGTPDLLQQHLSGDRPLVEAILAQCDGHIVGFALFFTNYSTFLTKPGLYLEDLFVQPDYRQRGIGKALLRGLANLALERGCGRLEWSVLDWNEPAIAFYQRLGASILPDWRICRVTEQAIATLAQQR